MTLRKVFLALTLLFLSGCVTYPDITQSRSPCRMEPGGWCDFVREAAVESYPYAIAATNAYQDDSDIFADIGASLVKVGRDDLDEDDQGKGFDYQVFEQFEERPRTFGWFTSSKAEKVKVARIIAFRGTDFDSATDLFYGTLRNDQIELALKYFEKERTKPRYSNDANLPWIVTGHSLGGALAVEVSAMYPDVKAWMFNVSPFYRSGSIANDGNRALINERGEALQFFRKYRSTPAANTFVLNCSPEASGITKHKIRRLADCITWIAAYQSKDALAVVKSNDITKPPVECDHLKDGHPGTEHVQTTACIHIARQPDDD